MIAGPEAVLGTLRRDEAGKMTFAVEFLPNEVNCPVFVNADLITAGLSPFRLNLAAVRAGRLMLQQIGEHVRRGDSFAFETTLSGRGHARRIPRWQAMGYRIGLLFLRLPTPENGDCPCRPSGLGWRTQRAQTDDFQTVFQGMVQFREHASRSGG